jgi:hypothetical protein
MTLRRITAVLAVVALAASRAAAQSDGVVGRQGALSTPRAFVENRGQWGNGSLFQMRRGNSVVAVTRDGFTIQMLRMDGASTGNGDVDEVDRSASVSGWNVELEFRGASLLARVEGVEPLPGIHNYLLGNDPTRWVTYVPGYSRVRIAGLYPGVDLEVYERDGTLEYDLVLQPGADPDVIEVDVRGAFFIDLSPNGALVLRTPWQDIQHSAATCLAEGESDGAVHAELRRLSPTGFGFEVSGWTGEQQLRIDPLVVYSTCLGGTNGEEPSGVAAHDGQVVVAGNTFSIDFPVTPGAFQESDSGSKDGFVTSFTADGSGLIFSTLFGGSNGEDVNDVRIAPDGKVIVVGSVVFAADFPVTAGAYDVSPSGSSDGFVAALTADGSGLDFCTLLGGSDIDPVTRVQVGPDGSVYVTGLTESPDFPTTPNAFAGT